MDKPVRGEQLAPRRAGAQGWGGSRRIPAAQDPRAEQLGRLRAAMPCRPAVHLPHAALQFQHRLEFIGMAEQRFLRDRGSIPQLGHFHSHSSTQFSLLSFVLCQSSAWLCAAAGIVALCSLHADLSGTPGFRWLFICYLRCCKEKPAMTSLACLLLQEPSEYGEVGVYIWDAHGFVSSKYMYGCFPTKGEVEFI